MPTALSDLTAQILEPSQIGAGPSAKLLADIRTRRWQAHPDSTSRTLSLLAWFGSGSGPCSGHPAHEMVPGLVLKGVPIAEIIASLQDPQADGRHFAGALRHLVGWRSRDRQERDIGAVPAALRKWLLQEAQTSGDRDKQARAGRWLGASGSA
jgi:hypothetical protein